MNYTFKPSLKDRALVKITAALWNRSDIRDLVAGCLTLWDPTIDAEKWQEIEDKVLGMVPKLPLPVSLKKEVLELAPRMGLEVKMWKEYHGYLNRHLGVDVSAELCWTPQGTVDRKKTAEVLVKDESIDIATRYRLACNYCLKNDVKELWNSMPGRKKDDIYDEEKKFCVENTLPFSWAYFLADSTDFKYSVRYVNKEAAEYFLQKLTPRERDESLMKCARDLADKHSYLCPTRYNYGDCRGRYDAEMLCFLLSQMDVEHQVKLLKDNPTGVLACLLDWPFQHFFMETANHVWGVLSEGHFQDLLLEMVYRVKNGLKNCNYHKLFREFWQQSPNTHKKYVASRLTDGLLLAGLLEIDDQENIRLIFKYVTLEERKEIIFSDKGMVICKHLIYSGKWDILKFYLQDCICEGLMFDLEEDMRNIMSRKLEESLESKNNLWMKVSQFLDELLEEKKKIRMEEKNSNPSKRLKFE